MAKRKPGKKSADNLTIEYVPIGSVKLDKTNPRIHDLDDVVQSMKAFGIRWPIIVLRSNKTIVAGHGRYKAMKKRGQKKIPVIWWDASEIEAKAFAIRDNKSTERSEWDFEALKNRFESLGALGVDLSLTGFNTFEIENINVAALDAGFELEPSEFKNFRDMVFQLTEKQYDKIQKKLDEVLTKIEGTKHIDGSKYGSALFYALIKRPECLKAKRK